MVADLGCSSGVQFRSAVKGVKQAWAIQLTEIQENDVSRKKI